MDIIELRDIYNMMFKVLTNSTNKLLRSKVREKNKKVLKMIQQRQSPPSHLQRALP